ncbi:glycosyltransferase [Tamlana sp. 62-3]|uniref:Glycosyltransferase n=1 Tax=Neotamlana sargassicola TaxID=2883125 RepID=A0A9X1I4T8_9FLAO|nr:glycosyltransferase [Tamlana sargassicola]MCB4807312.1 glycosyltransferase [Tamlana sargassicola]
MAIALRDKGYCVSVLSSFPLYPNWKPERTSEKISGIEIKRGGLYIRYSTNPFLRRAILELWYGIYVLIYVLKNRKSIDFVLPVFPPSLAFYVTSILYKKKTIKIGMIHDLQEVYSNGKRGFLNQVVSYFINKIEGKAFRNCDTLLFLSNEMKETAKELYKLSEDKLVVQYPFANINNENTTDILNNILPQDKIHIVYSGALSEKQNPLGLYAFYDFASKKIENCQFHIFSQGDIFNSLKKSNKNSLIFFHDLVPKESLSELYLKSTVQIVPQLPGTSIGSLPSKLPNLLISKCKTLVITDSGGEIEKLFKKYDLEKVVTSWDNNNLLNSLLDLLNNEKTIDDEKVEVLKGIFSLESMVNKMNLK